MRWWGQGCCMFANMRPGGRIWAKYLKLSICGSVSGVLCEMAVWGDARRWWVRVNNMDVVGGQHVCPHEAGQQDLGQKPETERSWHSFGCAVWTGGVG